MPQKNCFSGYFPLAARSTSKYVMSSESSFKLLNTSLIANSGYVGTSNQHTRSFKTTFRQPCRICYINSRVDASMLGRKTFTITCMRLNKRKDLRFYVRYLQSYSLHLNFYPTITIYSKVDNLPVYLGNSTIS